MEWRHNLVADDVQAPLIGTALTVAGDNGYTLWLHDPQGRKVRRVAFNAQGGIGKAFLDPEPAYDALLPHSTGYVLTRYQNGSALVTGHGPDHRELWQTSLPDADSPQWSLAGDSGKLHIAYSSCNPHDARRQAHIVTVVPNGDAVPFFTVPDDDLPLAQLVVAQPERLVVCVRNRGAATVVYILDSGAEVIHSGAFATHPHSQWAVPLCHTPLENGDILMGGYKEDAPGQRRAWVCRFDADMVVRNGKTVAGEHQAVTTFAPQPDGTVLALCPPWKILRLSAKGLLTHVWEVPSMLRRNSLSAILAAPEGGCFITGRSFSGKGNDLTPAVWLGKIALNEFMEL
jgi:hypothetical protein